MNAEYEVRMAGRVVSTRWAPSPREAAVDYVRSLGCPADEMMHVARDAVAWRGAVYRAAPASTTSAPPKRRRAAKAAVSRTEGEPPTGYAKDSSSATS
jgi:hypothetical protein